MRFNLVEAQNPARHPEFRIQSIARPQFERFAAYPGCGLDQADMKEDAKGGAFHSGF
jgi:hypothetical protein